MIDFRSLERCACGVPSGRGPGSYCQSCEFVRTAPHRDVVEVKHYPMYRSVWPCPVCPEGTEHFRDVSLPDGKVIEYRCAGCGYKHRAEKP